jgi:hypothetical protein
MAGLNYSLDQTDIYRTSHPKLPDIHFSSSVHGILSRIKYMADIKYFKTLKNL